MNDKLIKPDEEEVIYVSSEQVEKMEHLLENMDKARYELKKAIERVKPFKNGKLKSNL